MLGGFVAGVQALVTLRDVQELTNLTRDGMLQIRDVESHGVPGRVTWEVSQEQDDEVEDVSLFVLI